MRDLDEFARSNCRGDPYVLRRRRAGRSAARFAVTAGAFIVEINGGRGWRTWRWTTD
jgi:hypothetical protein